MSKIKKITIVTVAVVTIVCSSVIFAYNYKKPTKISQQKKWVLVWKDEFDGTNGSEVDGSKWVHDIGGNGWGNNEDEYYTDGSNNCYISDNNLIIEAKKEDYSGSKYTSARIKTKGKFEFKYGKVEMRAKIPSGQGIWPAFWMLGADIDKTDWPNCGEIDIMENVGKTPKTIYGTGHGPGYSGAMGLGNSIKMDEDFCKAYHTYSIEWSENKIEWFVDGKKYHSLTPQTIGGNKWIFNKDFYLLLNLAVGGNWPGYADDTTVFPQKYYIDYIHIYQLK